MTRSSKTIHVRYYALLREERGCSGEDVETSANTAAELYFELKQRHGFRLLPERLKVAINEEFQPWGVTLSDNDTVVFIPPVAGG